MSVKKQGQEVSRQSHVWRRHSIRTVAVQEAEGGRGPMAGRFASTIFLKELLPWPGFMVSYGVREAAKRCSSTRQ